MEKRRGEDSERFWEKRNLTIAEDEKGEDWFGKGLGKAGAVQCFLPKYRKRAKTAIGKKRRRDPEENKRRLKDGENFRICVFI